MKIKAAINGSYRAEIEIPIAKIELEQTIAKLEPRENTCLSYDRKRVYNSSDTPLYANGEILLARYSCSGKPWLNFEIVE